MIKKRNKHFVLDLIIVISIFVFALTSCSKKVNINDIDKSKIIECRVYDGKFNSRLECLMDRFDD